jgi:hypothetical protein
MTIARKMIGVIVLLIGVALGGVCAAAWADLMWPAVAAENYQSRHAFRALALDIVGGLFVWWAVAWPFAWLAERINPSPRQVKQ